MQDIDLESNDAPFALPLKVVRHAAEENRFILIGRPVIPRRNFFSLHCCNHGKDMGFRRLGSWTHHQRKVLSIHFPIRGSDGDCNQSRPMDICRQNVGTLEVDD